MSEPIALWERPFSEGDGEAASVRLFAFSRGLLDLDPPLSRERHGLPSADLVSALDLRHHERDSAPGWFDGFFDDALRKGIKKASATISQIRSAWIENQEVVVDATHPLAGKTLHFEVTVAAIRDATQDETEHGHPHGPTGHEGHGHHH